jgi:heptosyltransferase-2
VLVHCRALVANDSGALHLAAAVGINVAGVFGPTDDRLTSPRATSREARATILTHQTWCRPCGLRQCPLDHACMSGIGAGDVLAATRQML